MPYFAPFPGANYPGDLGADDPLDTAFPIIEQVRDTLTQARGIASGVRDILHPGAARKRRVAAAAAAAQAASAQSRRGVDTAGISPNLQGIASILPYVAIAGAAYFILPKLFKGRR